MLENDLLIERFFIRHEATLTVTQADALTRLMDLSDNDLLDLLLRRKEPGDELNSTDVHEVLGMLRPHPRGSLPPAHASANPQGTMT